MLRMPNPLKQLLHRIHVLSGIGSKLTGVIIAGSLIVYGALLASHYLDRRSTTIDSADATQQLITALMAHQFSEPVRDGDLREINRIIIGTIERLQARSEIGAYYGIEPPDSEEERRANLDIVAVGIFAADGSSLKNYVSPQHAGFDETLLSTYAAMVRSSGMPVTCLDDATELIGLPITGKNARGEPAGVIIVSWDMAGKFAGLTQAFWRDALVGGVATLALVFFLVYVIERTMTRPISALTRHVAQLGLSGEPGLVDDTLAQRHDEIGVLASEFNKMIETLADSRQKLQNQSYVHGMAEMASGVLHNIRNALNPISVGIWRLEETARAATVGRLDTALAELADPAVPADRKLKLASYVRGAAEKLVAQQHQLADEIKGLGEHSRHIEQILQDVDLTGRRRRQAEAIDLDKLVEDCARMIPNKQGAPVTVEIDTVLAELPAAWGNRITLTQVIGNLMVNAAESIRSAGVANGLITVTGSRDTVEGRDMIHLEVSDNGEGVAAEAMNSLFQRGFSTKKEKKGGIGLHWCANSIIAMGGKIHATSAGRGRGATFHLLLPIPPERASAARIHAA
jgi:signal transduction histidine kinase